MRIVKVFSATLAAAGLFTFSALTIHAKPEYSKKEKKGCTTCHVSAKSKDLNDTGKYYKEHKELPKEAK